MAEPVYELLAVDDNELNLGLFRLFLNQLGHKVTSVNNPFEAIDLVNTRHFDMVFTDVQMPGMSGIEAAATMREDGYSGPIVAITAHLSNLEESALESSNLNGFLIKPVAKQDLIRVIAEHLTEQAGYQEQPLISEIREPVMPATGTVDQEIYDLEIALNRANQSAELATEMMHLLAESLTDVLPLLDIENRDLLSEHLHKLAGGVRYSGASHLENILDETRRQLAANGPIDIDEIKEDIRAVLDWITVHPEPFRSV